MNNRPVLFTSACILSFIGSSIAAIVFFAVTLFYNYFSGKIIGITNELSMEGTSPFYFLLMAVMQSISLIAIITLWKYRKNGFYLYVLSQIAIIFIPIIFLNKNAFSSTNAIFTIVFVAIYFFYYRWIINNRNVSESL